MTQIVATTGNGAAAYAMKQINPDVCAAYPITPSTQVMEDFSEFVHDGIVNTNLVTVESEHSAMSACIGASAAGGRVMNATSANGLALMWEMLYIASGMRLPIILTVVNRALSAPINIHCDHSDAMGARDSGWIQLYSETAQEAYDNLIQAVRIAEHPDVLLPVMVNFDGFITSHSIDRVDYLEDEDVRKFIGEYKPKLPLLDVDNPISMGLLALQDYYIEFKKQQQDAMARAKEIIKQVAGDYKKQFNRDYSLYEKYNFDESDMAIIALNSSAGTIKYMIDSYKAKGINLGLLKLRVFRPFPTEELVEELKSKKVICVLDRSDSFGAQSGPLLAEIRSAMYNLDKRPFVYGKVYGLGGRDLEENHIDSVYGEMDAYVKTGKVPPVCEYITHRD